MLKVFIIVCGLITIVHLDSPVTGDKPGAKAEDSTTQINSASQNTIEKPSAQHEIVLEETIFKEAIVPEIETFVNAIGKKLNNLFLGFNLNLSIGDQSKNNFSRRERNQRSPTPLDTENTVDESDFVLEQQSIKRDSYLKSPLEELIEIFTDPFYEDNYEDYESQVVNKTSNPANSATKRVDTTQNEVKKIAEKGSQKTKSERKPKRKETVPDDSEETESEDEHELPNFQDFIYSITNLWGDLF